jgi:hypothetical protein
MVEGVSKLNLIIAKNRFLKQTIPQSALLTAPFAQGSLKKDATGKELHLFLLIN